MIFKSKLKELLKNEIHGLIAFSTVLIIGLVLICWYIIDGTVIHYNPTLVGNVLGISFVYFLLVIIGFKKRKIIKELKWSLENYVAFPRKVKKILKKRKATLKSGHGYISLYKHYDEALQLFYHLDFKKCA